MSLDYETHAGAVVLQLDETLYPLDAIYGTAYLFVDRCYVYLERPADKSVSVRLKGKAPLDEEALEALVGEFANELLDQVLRFRVGESSRKLREYTMAKAFFGGRQQSTIDQLLAELDAEELDEDPLEIEVPWETPPTEEQAGG